MRVSGRLAFAFASVGLACVVILVASYLQQCRVDGDVNELSRVELSRLHDVMELKALSAGTSARFIALNASKDPTVWKLFGGEMDRRVGDINRISRGIREWTTSPEEQAWWKDFDGSTKAIENALHAVASARQSGDDVAANRAFQDVFLPNVKTWDGLLDRLVEIQTAKLERKATELTQAGWIKWWVGSAVSALVLAIGAVTVASTVRRIARSLMTTCEVATEVAGGNLAVHVEIHGRDEFAELSRSFVAMASGLRSTVRQVQQSAQQIATASGEIAQGTFDLSERTERQAGYLQQTASTMEQLTETVRQTAEAAVQMSSLSEHARSIAEQSGAAVNKVIATMAEIEQSAQRVQEITGVIDGISFQTNILALNAAVEAAQAGDQGRGFAVVAGEVRKLAQRSAEAAKEIRALIAHSSAAVQSGSARVNEAGRTMSELQSSVQRVTTLITEVTTAAGEQRDGISDVSHVVSELEEATQQNAALVEQSAAATASMREQAATLAREVARFRLEPVTS